MEGHVGPYFGKVEKSSTHEALTC